MRIQKYLLSTSVCAVLFFVGGAMAPTTNISVHAQEYGLSSPYSSKRLKSNYHRQHNERETQTSNEYRRDSAEDIYGDDWDAPQNSTAYETQDRYQYAAPAPQIVDTPQSLSIDAVQTPNNIDETNSPTFETRHAAPDTESTYQAETIESADRSYRKARSHFHSPYETNPVGQQNTSQQKVTYRRAPANLSRLMPKTAAQPVVNSQATHHSTFESASTSNKQTNDQAIDAYYAKTSVSTASTYGTCVNFAQVIDRGMNEDPRQIMARARTDLAKSEVTLARANTLPQISAFVQAGLGDGRTITNQLDNRTAIQFSHDIFTFGANHYAKSAAKDRVKAAQFRETQSEQDVALQFAQEYLEIARVQELLALAREQEAFYAQDAASADQRLSLSAITRADNAQIKAALALAKADTANTKMLYENGLSRLSVLMNKDVNCIDRFTLPQHYGVDENLVMGYNVKQLLDMAFDSAPSIKAAKADESAAHKILKQANRASLPTVSISGYKTYDYNDVSDEFISQDRLGINIRQDIFTGLRNKGRQDNASARKSMAKTQVTMEQQEIENQLRTHLSRAKGLFQASQEIDIAARELDIRLQDRQSQYQSQFVLLNDVIRASDDYYSAKSREINARYQMYNHMITLEKVMNGL